MKQKTSGPQIDMGGSPTDKSRRQPGRGHSGCARWVAVGDEKAGGQVCWPRTGLGLVLSPTGGAQSCLLPVPVLARVAHLSGDSM